MAGAGIQAPIVAAVPLDAPSQSISTRLSGADQVGPATAAPLRPRMSSLLRRGGRFQSISRRPANFASRP